MRMIALVALAALASACNPAPAPETQDSSVQPDASALAPLELQPLAGADIDSMPLDGELGCSFAADGAMLLLAKGNVDKAARSESLIKHNGAVLKLQATETGGYDGMVEGARFERGDVKVDIVAASRNATGTEQVAYNATLTAHANGAERAYEGLWTCGP